MEGQIKIWVSKTGRQKLKKIFGCSQSTISDSLNYKRNSLTSRRIRMASVNVCGGIIL